jgi:imidazoleglycerol-phosphate dehydratase
VSKLKRETRETRIVCQVLKGTGAADVKTGDRFLTHMVETLARYAALDVSVDATGDMRHHLVEDVAITLGQALRDEIPAKAARYGWAVVPMDEALAEAAVDLGGRPYYVGRTPSKLYTHFLHSFATNLGATVHVRIVRGEDRHHMVEAAIKAVGLALRQALVEGDQVFSTKGSVAMERLT